jgi:membrane fusion protein (multidrug efflux system)
MLLKTSLLFLSSVMILASCSDPKDPETKTAGSSKPLHSYQFSKLEKGGISEQRKLPGQLAAFEEVSIFPKVNGYVKSVSVDIGSSVKKGQQLMELEAPELEQASLQAKERYARSKSDFVIDRENYERLKQASLTAGAVSPQDLASAKAKTEADSALSNAEKANWQMQETMRSYLRVTAPFAGVITERNTHPGALVSAEAKDNKPMLELKQTAHLRLQIDVPEGMVAGLKERSELSFYLSAYPGKKFSGRISRKSKNVNMQYRTERVEIDVDNKDGVLAPGMYADVLVNAGANPDAFTVPASAVITSTERKYVWVIRNGKTQRVDVSTGNQTTGRIEVFGQLQAGEEIIVNADDEIREGLALP